METGVKQVALSYSKGMTNNPSDMLSDDSELLECDGMIYRDGELKPIQAPQKIGTLGHKLVYVHKRADYENYICYEDKMLYVYQKTDSGFEQTQEIAVSELYDIQAVGNTLVVATSDGLWYLLYKGGTYLSLGTQLPSYTFVPKFTMSRDIPVRGTACKMDGLAEFDNYRAVYDANGNFVEESTSPTAVSPNGVIYQFCRWKYKDDSKTTHDSLQEGFQGGFSSSRTEAHEQGYFCFPFFVRVALRLYDGSFAKISTPIACYPTSDRNCEYVSARWDSTTKTWKLGDPAPHSDELYYFYCKLHGSQMLFSLNMGAGYGDWKDIIAGVVVFATEETLPFELEDEWEIVHPTESNGKTVFYNTEKGGDDSVATFSTSALGMLAGDVIVPTYKSGRAIREDMLDKSVYYKLFEIAFDDLSKYTAFTNAFEKELYDKHTIETLTTQEQLGEDDYYGWCRVKAKKVFSYNNRANIFDLERYPFRGTNVFQAHVQPMGGTTALTMYKIYTHIVSDSMDAWTMRTGEFYVSNNTSSITQGWLYYPDPNATEMVIAHEAYGCATIKLKKHPRLNGAYSFEALPNEAKALSWDSSATQPTVDAKVHETLDSNIYTTSANNPFTFSASGDNAVGTGSVIALAANTEAISQGQFGEYPLIVFTTEGIYAMGVNSEGEYVNIYPISREVCNNASSVTPIDDYVFFTSEKGLMAIRGRQVVCVSEQMRGRTSETFVKGRVGFIKYLEGCKIAYDYRDGLLLIFNEDYPAYHYIYNLQDKTFAVDTTKMNKGTQAIVGSYPDSLIQDADGGVYSLTGKPEINEDVKTYTGHVVTRPLRFGALLTLKSIRQIKHLFDFGIDKTASLDVTLYGSNDCKHWQKLTSLKGKPWKFFTLEYDFADLYATDTFAGTVVTYQPRRTEKMR